mmetsp:Transcript_49574/g.139567  ORF Transcript_49574/g.139567 Transcript_49574/m.139567 type:complete len:350 (+) Transcript_49574:71-1120(+)
MMAPGVLRSLLLCIALWALGLRCERIATRWHSEGARSLQASARTRRPISVLVAALGISAASAQSAGQRHFEETDLDGDGRISADEFIASVNNALDARDVAPDDDVRSESVEYFRRLFDYADMDGDGFLNAKEEQYADFVADHAGQEKTVQKVAAAASHAISAKGGVTESAAAHSDDFGADLANAFMAQNDKDGDGLLSREEYSSAMRKNPGAWGFQGRLDDPGLGGWLDGIFDWGDVDGDGMLGLKEAQYTAMVANAAFRAHASAHASARGSALGIMFEHFDRNKDGRIDEKEIAQAVAETHAPRNAGPPATTLAEAVLLHFAESDVDGDGSLDWEEAAKLASRFVGEF